MGLTDSLFYASESSLNPSLTGILRQSSEMDKLYD